MRPSAAVALALLALAGCNTDKDDAPTSPTDGVTTPEESAHTAVPPVDLTGQAGSIVLGHWPPDAYYPTADFFGFGLFVDDDGGIDNLASCLLMGGACVDAYPAVGAEALAHTDFAFLQTATFLDAGSTVEVGGTSMRLDFTSGFPLYVGTPPGFGGPGNLSFDGDLAPYDGADDFPFADTFELTSPDRGLPIELGPGGSLDLAWAPGAGDVYLEYGGRVLRLEDDGAESIAVDTFGLQAPFDSDVLILSRITQTLVDANGNAVQVQTRSDQWLYVNYTDTTGWTELALGVAVGETCGDAVALPPVGAGSYYGDLSTAADDHDLGDYNPLTDFATAGNDAVLPIAMTAGQTLTATFLQSAFDGALYVMDAGCDPTAALAGEDLTLDGEPEVLVFTAPADATYYLALDGWADGGSFTLELELL